MTCRNTGTRLDMPERCSVPGMRRIRLASILAALLLVGAAAPALAQGTVTVSIELAGNGTGTVVSEPAGISCPGTCSGAFAPGEPLTLVAAPDAGATFTGWGGACSGTDPCVLTPAEDVSVTARFADTYRVGAMIRGPGGGAFHGRWIVEPTPGPEQTVAEKAGRSERVTFAVRVVNDGAQVDDVLLQGTGDRGGTSVRYLEGDRDVTADVVAGTYTLSGLAPAEGVTLRLVVEVAPEAAISAERAWTIRATSAAEPEAVDAVRAEVTVVWRPVAFARAVGVTLVEPAREVVAVTYHESLFGSAAAQRPLGRLLINANPDKFDPPPETQGPDYIVMDSRGRPTPATSAADIVMEATTPARSPVSGRVMSVTPYRLYCSYPDVRVMIRPADDRARSVMVVHLVRVRVERGDVVVAGRTVLGRPRTFPFPYDTDDYVPGGHPHIHIEIERDGSSPLPGCR
jgi:hypothetical protein